MSTTSPGWVIARQRLRDDSLGTLLIWGLFLGVVAVITATVAVFGTVRTSAWEIASQFPRWYAGGVGVYLTAVYLPLYIAHGQTRRSFARQIPVVMLALVLLMAALMTLGYAIEHVVYRAAGWPQALGSTHLFSHPTDYPRIFLEFALVFAVWLVGGALAGAAFYRRVGLGLALVPVLLVVAGLLEVATTHNALPLASGVVGSLGLDVEAGSVGAAVAVAGGTTLLAAAGSWALIRDIPVRSRDA